MKWFSKLIDYFFTGMGFGAICYICILTFLNPGIAPTVKETISILILSGIIGLLSLIFRTDLPMGLAFGIHFVITFVLFGVMSLMNHWPISVVNILIYIVLYIIIWLIVILEQKKTVNRINAKIRTRNFSKKH